MVTAEVKPSETRFRSGVPGDLISEEGMQGYMAQTQVHKPSHTVLFACVHNAGRSQMACAWLKALADPNTVRSISAGTVPGERVHNEVREAMNEVGIDLSRVQPQKLTPDLAKDAQLLVTMGCGRRVKADDVPENIRSWHFLHGRSTDTSALLLFR